MAPFDFPRSVYKLNLGDPSYLMVRPWQRLSCLLRKTSGPVVEPG